MFCVGRPTRAVGRFKSPKIAKVATITEATSTELPRKSNRHPAVAVLVVEAEGLVVAVVVQGSAEGLLLVAGQAVDGKSGCRGVMRLAPAIISSW